MTRMIKAQTYKPRATRALFLVVATFCLMAVLGAGEAQAFLGQEGSPMYAWGNNLNGQLGQGTSGTENNSNVPLRVGVATNWVHVSTAAGGAVAVNTEGHLYTWGQARNAPQMGHGGTGGSDLLTRPTRVGTGSDWAAVSFSGTSVLALTTDGRLYGWGTNLLGQLGVGDTDPRYVPTRVGDRTDWAQISNAGTGAATAQTGAMGVTTGGLMFSWGTNANGRLGLGVTGGAARLTPQQVGTETNWKLSRAGANASYAINQDGELFAMGSNAQGRLGLGFVSASVNTPTRVGTADNWVDIALQLNHGVVAALTSDGEIFTWSGTVAAEVNHLGRAANAAAPANLPNRLDNRTDWIGIGGGNQHTLAMTEGFELYAWGTNTLGQLGIGRSSPNNIETRPAFVLQTFGLRGFSQTGAGSHSMALFWTDPPPLPLIKTLQMPQGITLPEDLSFDFYFTPVDLDSPSFFPGPPIAGNPLNVTVESTPTATAGSVFTSAGDLNLWDTIYNVTFPHGGVFVWNVHEGAESSGVNALGTGYNMSYDTGRFQIQVDVDAAGNIREVFLFPLVYSAGSWTTGTKQGYIEFVNTLTYTPLPDSPANLVVTKHVVGDRANLTQLYDFTLTLTPHALAPLPGTVSARIVGPGDTVVDRPTTRDGNVFTFQLLYNERLEVFYLPVGTTFAVTEGAAQSFLPSFRTYSGGTLVHSATGSTNTALTADHAGQVVAQQGRNAADFVNTHQFVPLTGLSIAGISVLVIAALLVFGVAALIASRRRKNIEYFAMH